MAEDTQSLDIYWTYNGEDPDEDGKTVAGYGALFYDAMIPHSRGVHAFSEFMHDRRVEEHVKEHLVTCLMDALALWVDQGNATLVCPTFTDYLQVVIQVIAEWNFEGGWRDGNNEFSFRRTVSRDDYVLDQSGFVATRRSDNVRLIMFPTLVRPDSEVGIWNHPALSMTAFEYARHRRLTGQAPNFYLD